ncbi:MAG: di-trans,poly-cis-decaprenylcistransferase [Spirochaetaceae bacterium]|jgi:undecaprenyl diphosphate synthase|nr:di-trans,poly-cis-decaprenylcistransferase [Spirochaetaceae bacterium]
MSEKTKGGLPVHVGIIMDGNGRWAARQGRPRTDGHLEGLKTARKIVEASVRLGIRYLTLYVFSTENWKRAESEVQFIMNLVKRYLVDELNHYRKDRLRVRHAGDLSGLPAEISAEVRKACEDTRAFDGMQVILALNYGGRNEIIRAVNRILDGKALNGESVIVNESAIANNLDNPDVPDPDLIIRTAGEFRTSNFLLWEGAYSEYYISSELWPDWTESHLRAALDFFACRERRFGGAE